MKRNLILLIVVLLVSVGNAFAQPATNSFQIWGADYNYLYSIDGPDPTMTQDQVLLNSPHGFYPGRKLTMVDGKIYGVTMASKTPDTPGFGQIFEAGYQSGYRFVYTFPSPDGVQAPDGKTPQTLTLANGKLYGVTSEGGANNKGVLFEFDPNTLVYTKKFDFDSLSGYAPGAGLTLAANGKLYGLTPRGGIYGYGTLYEFNPATGNYSRKVDFDGTTNGWRPENEMTLAANNKLYGWHELGWGAIFEYDPATNAYAIKYNLNLSTDGGGFFGPLMHASNGKIYGGTYYSPDYYAGPGGVLFEYDYVANTYTAKHDFNAVWNDGKVFFGMVEAPNGKLYGNTLTGGPYVVKAGNLFEFDPATSVYTNKINYIRQSSSIPLMVRTQKITIDPVSDKMIWDGPFAINATGGTSGNPVHLTSSHPGVISMSGNVATVTGYGGTRITATQAGNDKYWPAPEAEIVIWVLRDQTITFDPLPEKYFGDAPFAIAATVSSGRPGIVYTSSNPAVATISGSTVTITGVGTTTITAYHNGKNGNTPVYIPVSATQDLTVIKGNQHITFDALPQKTLGNAAFPLTATASSGLALSYTSSNTAVATVSGNTITLVGPGTTTITASQAGNVNYNAAADVQQTLTVKLPQTITFDVLPAKTYEDASFTLTATASSALAVTYVSSNPGVATVSGNTVTILVAGTTTITAAQAGNVTYDPAPDVPQILTVNKKAQTITFDALTSKTFQDAPFALTATASSGLPVNFASSNASVATVSGNTVTIVGAGTTTITASQSGDANRSAAPAVPRILTVNKKDQTITFNTLVAKTFGNAPFALTATASSGLPVTYASSNTSVATISGNTVTIVGAGTTTITASQNGDANRSAATNVPQILTVNKNDQTITFAALSAKLIDDASFTLTGTASSALAVSYVSSNTGVATISGNTVTITGVGTTTITASQSGNGNYNAAADVPRTLTVNKRDQTITFNPLADKRFNDAPFALSATSSSGLAVTYSSSNTSVATVSGNVVTIIAAGSTTITASQNGNALYNPADDVPQTLAVRKRPQTITFPPIPYPAYGDAPFALTATASSGLPVTFEYDNNGFEWIVASLSGNIVTVHESGWAYVTARQAGNADYEPASLRQDLIVFVLEQKITFGPLANRTFGDAPFALTATVNSSLPVSYTSSNTSVATVSGNTVTIMGAGTTTITARQDEFGISFDAATPVAQTLTVNKASQTITFNSLESQTVGDAPFNLTATASSALPVSYISSNTSVATVSGSTVMIVGAGTTTITASQAGNVDYNAAMNVPQILTVKANQTITFPALPWTAFNDPPLALNATSSSGLTIHYTSSNTNVATVSGNILTIVGVGNTTITASQSGNANYGAAPDVEQAFTVNLAGQDITFGPLPGKTFGDAPFALTATTTSGLPASYESSNTDVATISGNIVTIVGAGTTEIHAWQDGNANYDATNNISQTLVVEKANQNITFSALGDRPFDIVPFTLNATASSGLAIQYSSSNTNVATVSGNTVILIGIGTTVITASQSGDLNYHEAVEITQALTINKATQTITFNTLADKTIGDAAFDLLATVNSNLAIKYTSTSDKITVDDGRVSLVKPGRASITASQEGNNNYHEAAPVSRSFCIKPVKPIILFSNENQLLTSSAGEGNQWFFNGSPIAGATSATLSVTQPGIYSVQIRVDDCVSEFSADQVLIVTNTESNVSDMNIDVFPNPTSEWLNVLFGNLPGKKEVSIFQLNGAQIISEQVNGNNITFQLSDYPSGTYVLKVKCNNKVKFVQFIKD